MHFILCQTTSNYKITQKTVHPNERCNVLALASTSCYLTFFSLNFARCLQLLAISFRLLSARLFWLVIISYFSDTHKSHLLVPQEYGRDLDMRLHFTSNGSFCSFNVQMYCDNDVALRCWALRKLDWWP